MLSVCVLLYILPPCVRCVTVHRCFAPYVVYGPIATFPVAMASAVLIFSVLSVCAVQLYVLLLRVPCVTAHRRFAPHAAYGIIATLPVVAASAVIIL